MERDTAETVCIAVQYIRLAIGSLGTVRSAGPASTVGTIATAREHT